MPNNDLKHPKRGAMPSPRHELASATPHVALPSVPPHHLVFPEKISMWDNYYNGDCVTAEEAFAKACHRPDLFITDNEVEAWATSHGWFQGATLIEVLKAMQIKGFQEHGRTYDDGSINSVDWTSASTLQSAIFHGPVKLGVAGDQLDTLWLANGGNPNGGNNGWFATGFHADPNEDHCVSLCGYGTIKWLAEKLKAKVPSGVDGTKQGYALFTWGSIGVIDVPSMLAITQEAWLRTPTTIIVH